MALPKSGQKARHLTRCSAALRARRNPLRFSPVPGCSDSTSMYCFASAAIHRRAPSGCSVTGCDARHRERCRDPRIRPSVDCVEPDVQVTEKFAERARGASGCFCGRMPPKRGPVRRGEGAQEKARRGPRRMRGRSLLYMDVQSANLRSAFANPQGRMPGGRAFRGVLSLVTLFAQAKRVTRSAAGRVEALLADRPRARE